MTRRAPSPTPVTPQAKLSAIIKRARDTMRKDAGLNGDLDRIPQLAWLLFLKAFDGLEANREITERRYRPAIDAPYRWRDWAADPVSGRTGEVLLKFVNGKLLPYLPELKGTGTDDPRDVIAAVFKETFNRGDPVPGHRGAVAIVAVAGKVANASAFGDRRRELVAALEASLLNNAFAGLL